MLIIIYNDFHANLQQFSHQPEAATKGVLCKKVLKIHDFNFIEKEILA